MMALFVTTVVYVLSTAIIGSCLQLGPEWLLANSCHSSMEKQDSALLRLQSNISAFLDGLVAVSQCGDGLWYR